MNIEDYQVFNSSRSAQYEMFFSSVVQIQFNFTSTEWRKVKVTYGRFEHFYTHSTRPLWLLLFRVTFVTFAINNGIWNLLLTVSISVVTQCRVLTVIYLILQERFRKRKWGQALWADLPLAVLQLPATRRQSCE